MRTRLKRYKKSFEYGYAFGVFPTLELLINQPESVLSVVAHPKGFENIGIDKIQQLCKNNLIDFVSNTLRQPFVGPIVSSSFPSLNVLHYTHSEFSCQEEQKNIEKMATHVFH